MTRENPKYPTAAPQEAPSARGPSWRDVYEALDELHDLIGFEYTVQAWPSRPQGAKRSDSLCWYLRTSFDRPWADEEFKYGVYARFPHKDHRTVPALLLALIDREDTLYRQWKEPLKQGALFGE